VVDIGGRAPLNKELIAVSRSTSPTSVVLAAPLAAALALTGASAASAAENVNREFLSRPTTDEVVATCADGSEVGLGFDLTRNVHNFYDSDGELVRQSRNVNYVGTFENFGTGERYTFRGTRIVTFDFVNGTFTSRGNYRTVTMPGAGTVLHAAGIYVEDLDVEGLFYHQAGPNFDEWAPGGDAAVCSLFGLEAAT
jgi:hypothetical protein